jgi:hypothetical protein
MKLELQEFTSSFYVQDDAQNNIVPAELFGPILHMQNGLPAALQNENGESVEIVVFPLTSLDQPEESEFRGLRGLAHQYQTLGPFAILLVDKQDSHILGLVLPDDIPDLKSTFQASIPNETDLGTGSIFSPSIGPGVQTVIFGCPNYPSHPGFAVYQSGSPKPSVCPICHQALIRIKG